jgi:hypothetical protein
MAFAAGALVASDKAQLVLDNLSGEFRPPKASWLGLLPGLTAGALVLCLYWSAPWLYGLEGELPGEVLVGVLAVASVVTLLISLKSDGEVMLAALREVSALDGQRLAHVELVGPSALERAWFRLTLDRVGQRVAFKDASIARRRYPMAYFATFIGVVLVGIAMLAADDVLIWAAIVAAVLGAYAVVMARRGRVTPIEQPQLLKSLPMTKGQLTRAKASSVLLRGAVLMVFIAVPASLTAPAAITAAAVLGGIIVATTVVALLTAS